MKNLILLISLLVISFTASARKPAVEDFVGVEPETYKATPPGTEVLFNFDQNVQEFQDQKPQNAVDNTAQPPWMGLVVFGAFLVLPSLMWFALAGKQKKTTAVANTNATTTEHNVHNLEDYRPETTDDQKKAS